MQDVGGRRRRNRHDPRLRDRLLLHIAARVTAFPNWITEVIQPHLTGMDCS